MTKIRKNDTVYVIAGKDKGKTGKVLQIMKNRQRAIVENINIMKKAQRKTQENQQGGFIEIEAPIHLSNLMILDKKTNKPSRMGVSIAKNGSKKRIAKKSGEEV